MRTRDIIRQKYRADLRGDTRFACRRYYDYSCPHYEDVCECPRNDMVPIEGQPERDKSRDNCPDFVQVSMKLWQEVMVWTREELLELL